MTERKSIRNSVRFEVFKRDKFKCQYCGAEAPQAVLEVDHIKPVAEGGTNDIINLVTACWTCNSGKGARELSDDSAITKQKTQLNELEERRQQLEMMAQWRDGLEGEKSAAIGAIVDRIIERTGYSPNQAGQNDLRLLLRKYSLAEVLHAMDEAFDVYLKYVGDEVDADSWNAAFNKIGSIAAIVRQSKDKPYLRRLFYIQGILRKRLRDRRLSCVDALESLVIDGLPVEDLELLAKRAENWDEFYSDAEDLWAEMQGDDQ